MAILQIIISLDRQMATILPTTHIEHPSEITINDQVHPEHQDTTQAIIPLPFIIHPIQEPPMQKHIEEIKDRRVFSWSNIFISLSLFAILSVTVYLYWPQTKQESKIEDLTKTLMDISQIQPKQLPIITHPNDGSSAGSTSSNSNPSTRNDKSHRSSGAIPKNQNSYSYTIVGNGGDGDDKDDEDDPNKKDKKDCGCGGGIYTDPEDDSDEMEDEEDDEELMEEDDQEMNWLAYPDDPSPLVGSMHP